MLNLFLDFTNCQIIAYTSSKKKNPVTLHFRGLFETLLENCNSRKEEERKSDLSKSLKRKGSPIQGKR